MTRPGADARLGDLALGALAALIAVSAVLRAAGSVAALVNGVRPASGGLAAGLGVLRSPAVPGSAFGIPELNPFLYWSAVTMMLVALTVLVGGAVHVWMTVVRGWQTGRDRLAGTGTRGDVRRHASARSLARRGATLRPSLPKPSAPEVGYLLGNARGHPVWASVEDSLLLVGPPRSGKGLHVVINAILDAPGAVVTTSTRPDNLAATLHARRRKGPVAVFDPQRLAPGVPAGMRWSLVRGCQDPLTAMIRAAGLAASSGFGRGGVEDASFWEGKTRTVVQALLHAAALDGRDASSIAAWSVNPALASDAVRILQSAPAAAAGWAESLDSVVGANPRTRDSIWQGVSLAFAALADPRVLDAVTPNPGEGFEPGRFLAESGTLYLLATGAGAGASAPLVSALIEDIVEVARRRAAISPGARLDPPLLAALDEIGNLAPLPSLPTLMAEGGGTGITMLPVLQSLAQARQKWGEHHANAIWDASIVKIILGGASNPRDLQDLSTLTGERDEPIESITTDDTGGRSTQRSMRRVPVLPPDALRTLRFGTAVILLRTAPPLITRLRAWTSRTDARQLAADREVIETSLRATRTPDDDSAPAH